MQTTPHSAFKCGLGGIVNIIEVIRWLIFQCGVVVGSIPPFLCIWDTHFFPCCFGKDNRFSNMTIRTFQPNFSVTAYGHHLRGPGSVQCGVPLFSYLRLLRSQVIEARQHLPSSAVTASFERDSDLIAIKIKQSVVP